MKWENQTKANRRFDILGTKRVSSYYTERTNKKKKTPLNENLVTLSLELFCNHLECTTGWWAERRSGSRRTRRRRRGALGLGFTAVDSSCSLWFSPCSSGHGSWALAESLSQPSAWQLFGQGATSVLLVWHCHAGSDPGRSAWGCWDCSHSPPPSRLASFQKHGGQCLWQSHWEKKWNPVSSHSLGSAVGSPCRGLSERSWLWSEVEGSHRSMGGQQSRGGHDPWHKDSVYVFFHWPFSASHSLTLCSPWLQAKLVFVLLDQHYIPACERICVRNPELP